MDGGVQPVIAVLGNPIEGNPTQLAIERALEQIDLDWRVLSMNVAADDLDVAIEGLRVCGFRALLIDDTLRRNDAPDTYFLHDQRWTGGCVRDQWLESLSEKFAERFAQVEDHEEPVRVANNVDAANDGTADDGTADDGTEDDGTGKEGLGDDVHNDAMKAASEKSPPPNDNESRSDLAADPSPSMPRGRLYVLRRPADVAEDFWADLGEHDCVVMWCESVEDPSSAAFDESSEVAKVTAARVIGPRQVRLAILRDCLQLWTGCEVDVAVMEDAMEEYHSV